MAGKLLVKGGEGSTSLAVCDGLNLRAKMLVVKLSGHLLSPRDTPMSYKLTLCCVFSYLTGVAGGNDFQWCFSQVKGAIDEDVAEGMWLTLAARRLG